MDKAKFELVDVKSKTRDFYNFAEHTDLEMKDDVNAMIVGYKGMEIFLGKDFQN